MNECYSFWIDVFVPLISAIIGGGLTLLGVIWTINAENKKSKNEYLERIRPFLVVENPSSMDPNKERIPIWINDDSEKSVENGQTLFHWNSLCLSNMGETVCMLGYVKINNTYYDVFDSVPIKADRVCEIKGYPLSTYISNSIENISIGFFDRNFNLYEYNVIFELEESKHIMEKMKKYTNKDLSFTLIDCSKNIASKRRRKQYDYKRKTI